MSNEYNDWMNDGGACGDCVYNLFLDSEAVCALDQPQHKSKMCSHFKHWEMKDEA